MQHLSGRPRGFSLVELLVVMAIIATLVSILLPAITGAQKSARALQCASNIKQIVLGLTNYTVNNKGQYPPSYVGMGPGVQWHDNDVLGPYLLGPQRTVGKNMGGGAFVCPEDDRSQRSYSMNLWMMSDTLDGNVTGPNPKGALWRGAVFRRPTSIILITERWSTAATGTPTRYFAPATIGGIGDKPGKRFGMAGGVTTTPSSHWGTVACELPYMWHHRNGDGPKGKNAYGRINIGYVDGHVEMKTADQLADRVSGLSRLDSWWSPWDEKQNVP